MSAVLLGLRGKNGWVSEGLDHYLVYLVTGTRILSSVTDPKSRYGESQPGLPDITPRGIDQDDWLVAAATCSDPRRSPTSSSWPGRT